MNEKFVFVFSQIWLQCFSIFIHYFTTITLFPSILSQVQSATANFSPPSKRKYFMSNTSFIRIDSFSTKSWFFRCNCSYQFRSLQSSRKLSCWLYKKSNGQFCRVFPQNFVLCLAIFTLDLSICVSSCDHIIFNISFC